MLVLRDTVFLFFFAATTVTLTSGKKGHFRALLTNFPSGFPVFRLTVRYEFPKDRPRWGTDPIFMQVTSRVTQGRLGAPTAAVYAEEDIMQFKQGAGIEAMQHPWQQKKNKKETGAAKKKKILPGSQVTWGVCVRWWMENSAAEQCFLEGFDRKGCGYNLHHCAVTIKWLISPPHLSQ